jgi:hypothetical protein
MNARPVGTHQFSPPFLPGTIPLSEPNHAVFPDLHTAYYD